MSRVSASSSHMSVRVQNRSTIPAATAATAPTTSRRMNQVGATHGESGSWGRVPAGSSIWRGETGSPGAIVVPLGAVSTSTADASTVSMSAW